MLLLAQLLLAATPTATLSPQGSSQGSPLGTPQNQASTPAEASQGSIEALAPPETLYDVLRVVDGDTLHIQMGADVEKLRLLSVDTEERLRGNPNSSTTKPETLFGEECAVWAQEFFADLAEGDAPTQIGLRFPPEWNGEMRRDIYGRLLCHVLLADGRDFNLLLVELGKSPYFNKYGNSLVCHDEFVAAQARAMAAKRGIWDPTTNTPKTAGAPAAKRPYAALMAWWQVRADAIDAHRARAAARPAHCANAEDPASLARAHATCAAKPDAAVEVFGTIDRFFDEDDGSVTVLFRSGDKRRAFRAVLPAGKVDPELVASLKASREEFRQNYWSLRGRLETGDRGGWTMQAANAKQWTPGGPEPVIPAEASAPAKRVKTGQ